jgi:hypothetical protein
LTYLLEVLAFIIIWRFDFGDIDLAIFLHFDLCDIDLAIFWRFDLSDIDLTIFWRFDFGVFVSSPSLSASRLKENFVPGANALTFLIRDSENFFRSPPLKLTDSCLLVDDS